MSTPTLPAGHDEFETLAVAWAFAALEPDEQARFEAHAAEGCDPCADQVAAALAVGLELAYAVPDEDPPAALRDRVLAAAAVPALPGAGDGRMSSVGEAVDRRSATVPRLGPPLGPVEPDWIGVQEPARPDAPEVPGDVARRGRGRHSATGRRPVRRLVAGLVAAAVVGVSAVTTWQVVGEGPGVPAGRVAALSAPADNRSVATVVVSDGRAEVVTDVLPPNGGRGTQYVLWGVPPDDGGAPKALGSFVVTAASLHSYAVRLSAPVSGYSVLAVSEEPAGALPATPSRVLARGALNP